MDLPTFQFTHPGGVRQISIERNACVSLVSIHAPGRGATTGHTSSATTSSYVSIHAPGRGATKADPRGVDGHPVSIHAPGRGATLHCNKVNIYSYVSIHAPGRGATEHPGAQGREPRVSIHAPGRGATLCGLQRTWQALCFNSRTREGCDQKCQSVTTNHQGFNSRTREGCDLVLVAH